MKIQVVKNVLKANDAVAEANRRRLDEAGILALNVTSAPGSGKTALLEATIAALAPELKTAVVVGDLQTTRDAERLEGVAHAVTQINTEGGCHLQATQVAESLEGLPLDELDLLFIENVGNMVCPAGYDLGEHLRLGGPAADLLQYRPGHADLAAPREPLAHRPAKVGQRDVLVHLPAQEQPLLAVGRHQHRPAPHRLIGPARGQRGAVQQDPARRRAQRTGQRMHRLLVTGPREPVQRHTLARRDGQVQPGERAFDAEP